MQKLFSVNKIGLFLDSYSPATEKRRDEDVKVLVLTLRVQPFDAKLATAIDDGLGDDSAVRASLFKLAHPDPKPHIERLNFSLACPRQNLTIYASPDTDEARITLLQAKISGCYARTQKDVAGFAFVFKATIGPVGRDELEYVHAWVGTQRFVAFEESEPALDFDDMGDAGEGADEMAGARPTPMFDDAGAETADAAADAEEPSAGRKVAQFKTAEARREKGHRYPKPAGKAKRGRAK